MNEIPSQQSNASQDFALKVLDRIEEERVVPRPRWQFTMKNRLFWVLGVLSVIVGSLLAAALVFALVNAGWEYREITHHGFFGFASQILPTLWIVALLGALLLAYENFRHTSRGYRVSLIVILGLCFMVVVFGGALFYFGGAGRLIEEEVGGRIPMYRPVMMQQKMMWSRPEQGLLAGQVIEYDKVQSLLRLRGFDGNTYLLTTKDLADDSLEVLTEVGESVRVMGAFAKLTDGSNVPFFRPCYVFPWEPRHSLPKIHGIVCTGERIIQEPRSTDCKGLVPHEALQTLHFGACR